MVIDPRKQFRIALRDALSKTPQNSNFPSVMKSRSEESLNQLETITKESISSNFFMEEPRTDFELKSRAQRDQARLEYPPDKAPAQYLLQKRTSHLTLTTAPVIQHMTPLQLKASQVREIKAVEKTGRKPKYTILEESQVSQKHKFSDNL